jgi:hypothetical protein
MKKRIVIGIIEERSRELDIDINKIYISPFYNEITMDFYIYYNLGLYKILPFGFKSYVLNKVTICL